MLFAVFHGAPRPHAKPPAKPHAHERPWLSHEAMRELVGEGGGPGPLFADLSLGGPAPSIAARARIAEFARANGIEIRLEVADDELSAIRVGVAFGGCCGYEGTDALGRLLHRTHVYDGCEDCRGTPASDWSSASDDGIAIHGHVAVNRIDVRWEAMLTLPELLDRAEAIAGRPRATVRAHAGDRWREGVTHPVLDVPFAFTREGEGNDHGLHLAIEHGRIAEVSFELRGQEGEELGDLLRKRWGRPRIADGTWTWRTAERVITADPDSYDPTIVIRATAPAQTTALERAAATPAPRS
ncbi:MAG TPA: hypothetical protein VIV58_23445 [Kofleriaceae bacterium]